METSFHAKIGACSCTVAYRSSGCASDRRRAIDLLPSHLYLVSRTLRGPSDNPPLTLGDASAMTSGDRAPKDPICRTPIASASPRSRPERAQNSTRKLGVKVSVVGRMPAIWSTR